MPPQGPDLVLATDVPDSEADVLVLHSLHVEADGGDGGDDLAELQLVQDGSLTRRVQAHWGVRIRRALQLVHRQ